MLPLLALKAVSWKRVAGVGLATAFVGLIAYVRLQGIALDRAELVYHNPQMVKVERKTRQEGPKTRREGPSTKETRIKELPDGTKETVVIETKGPVEETRGPVLETTDAFHETRPVFQPLQLDRWLVIGGPSWRPGEPVEWSAGGGRSWGNRIDLTAELSNRGRIGARIALRFGRAQ